MGQQRKSGAGCFIIAAILGVVMLGAVAVGFIYLTRARVAVYEEMPEFAERHATAVVTVGAEDAGDRLVFADGKSPKMTIPQPGEEVTREQFAAYMLDEAATELARDSFQKATDQGEIRWKLKLREVSDRNGKLHGQFTLPWTVREGQGSSGSSISIDVWFDEAGRDSLLNLRVGDWVTVAGRLSYQGGKAAVMDAVPADAPVAEKP